jgi:hypothetical protein
MGGCLDHYPRALTKGWPFYPIFATGNFAVCLLEKYLWMGEHLFIWK